MHSVIDRHVKYFKHIAKSHRIPTPRKRATKFLTFRKVIIGMDFHLYCVVQLKQCLHYAVRYDEIFDCPETKEKTHAKK